MTIDYPTNAQLPQLRRLWQTAFGDSDAFLDGFYATGYSPRRCRWVNMDGQVAAGLYWFDGQCRGQTVAYLYAVATAPEYRHRGLCRTLLEDTHDLLASSGYAAALLVPEGDALRQMYTAFGYRNWGGKLEWHCQAGLTPLPLRQINPEEYARLRRQLLPAGAVIQEGSSLAYLATFAQFYTGEGVLLAAARDGDSLRAMELLGNPDAAPGILRALSCTGGTFSAPGDAPFAMCLPLKSSFPPSGYFGLDLA